MVDSTSPPQKTLGLYTPYLQGFYFGELVSQIQQYCIIKGYKFTVIKTDSFATFNSAIHTEHIDYFVILRNAIHNTLAEYLVNSEKPIVSIAYDYFPLAIPMVTSDNEMGMELAVNHLLQKGHRQLAFVGDLSHFDIRKRYESFCDQHKINGFEIHDDDIFIVNDTLFSGGYQAANEFALRNCKATGVICAASLTSIGFGQQLENLSASQTAKENNIGAIDIVGFDAISLTPISQPNMTMIDQNLHLVAYKAISLLEKIHNKEHFDLYNAVEPKIITPTSGFMQTADAFLATSTEIDELHNANYMKSVISNLYEWPKNIAQNNLDTLMTIAPLFEKHMQKACYGRLALSKDGKEYIKILKTFSPLTVKKLPSRDLTTLTTSELYPAKCADVFDDNLDMSVHLPIFQHNKLWSILSVYGSSKQNRKPSSFSGFCAYLDNIANQLNLHLLSKSPLGSTTLNNNEHKKDEQNIIIGKILWNTDNNITLWDEEALSSLGLRSKLEQNIYKNLDLTDRVHPDDDAILREALINAKNIHFNITVRLKHKNKNYQTVQLEKGEHGQNASEIPLIITLQNDME